MVFFLFLAHFLSCSHCYFNVLRGVCRFFTDIINVNIPHSVSLTKSCTLHGNNVKLSNKGVIIKSDYKFGIVLEELVYIFYFLVIEREFSSVGRFISWMWDEL